MFCNLRCLRLLISIKQIKQVLVIKIRIKINNNSLLENQLKKNPIIRKIDPKYKDAWNNKGIAFRNLNKYENALKW